MQHTHSASNTTEPRSPLLGPARSKGWRLRLSLRSAQLGAVFEVRLIGIGVVAWRGGLQCGSGRHQLNGIRGGWEPHFTLSCLALPRLASPGPC